MYKEKHNRPVSPMSIKSILKAEGVNFNKLSSRKRDILTIGCELLFLTKEDICYIADPKVSDSAAENRLCQKRLGNFGR